VLVVDDAADLRELMAISLRLAGAVVTTVASGAEALDLLRSSEAASAFDAVVIDVQMPDVDGWDVLAAVRALGASAPPAVMCSVKSSDADRERAVSSGAVAYITKPFDVSRAVALILDVGRGVDHPVGGAP
jgi:CheY-like chemotaxis protein